MSAPGLPPSLKSVFCISELDEKEDYGDEKSDISVDTETQEYTVKPSIYSKTSEFSDRLNQLDSVHPVDGFRPTFDLVVKKKQLNAKYNKRKEQTPIRFPISSLNHMSFECINVKTSANFYKNVFGFKEIARPAFEQEGVWLYTYNMSIHLLQTYNIEKRYLVKQQRLEYFMENMPGCDHFAFLTSDLDSVEEQLKAYDVIYRKFISDLTGIQQIFIFDPDANVIEVSNCAPLVGETTCSSNNTSRKNSQIDIVKTETENGDGEEIHLSIKIDKDNRHRRDSVSEKEFLDVLPTTNENKTETLIDNQIDIDASYIDPEKKLTGKSTFETLQGLFSFDNSLGEKNFEQLKEENRLLRQIIAEFVGNESYKI